MQDIWGGKVGEGFTVISEQYSVISQPPVLDTGGDFYALVACRSGLQPDSYVETQILAGCKPALRTGH